MSAHAPTLHTPPQLSPSRKLGLDRSFPFPFNHNEKEKFFTAYLDLLVVLVVVVVFAVVVLVVVVEPVLQVVVVAVLEVVAWEEDGPAIGAELPIPLLFVLMPSAPSSLA